MHIKNILKPGSTPISFEFFPPRTPEAAKKLGETLAGLKEFKPACVSLTYGAGGSTRELTRDWVLRLREEICPEVVPHLTCVGHSEEEVTEILEHYARSGVGNILALRGDAPRAETEGRRGAFARAADLVRFIRRFEEKRGTGGEGFGIGVAGFPEGHPGTPNRLLEMDYLKAKVDAGADYICTQLFFDNRDFYDFRERCDLAGIRVPIVAGILPVGSIRALPRMAELAGGARFPAKLLKKLREAGGDEGGERKAGVEYATEQCADLIREGADGIHLYTLNQSGAAREILQNLRSGS